MVPIKSVVVWGSLWLLVFGWFSVASAKKQEGISAQLLQIDSFLSEGKYIEGVALGRKLETKYGDNPLYGWQIDGRLGLALLLANDFPASIPFLEAAVMARPKEPVFHRNLGSALVALGHKGRALSEFSQAVELDPRNAAYQLELGQLFLELKNYRQAQAHLELARGLCKGCPEASRALGHSYMAAGANSLAIGVFETLLEADRCDSSRRDLVQALQMAGDDSRLVDLLGHWPLGQLKADELHLLINAERRLGRWEYAKSILTLRLSDGNAKKISSVYNRHQFWGEVSYSLLISDKLDDALNGFDLALEIEPGNHAYTNNRQVVLNKIAERDEN